jgi:Homeodomain-like domain
MSAKQYVVSLTGTERAQLERAARSNKRSRRERVRARVLLGVDTAGGPDGWTDAQASQCTGASLNTVARVRQRFALQGCAAALHHAEQPRRKARRLDGAAEAHLIALVCSTPPQGRKGWSLHLLAGRLVQAGYTDSVSHETVRQTLKKTRLNLG